MHVYIDRLPAAGTIKSPARLLGHDQVTDAYLLHIAQLHKAVFVTFDGPLRGLAEAGSNVEVLG
jgi:hypothetical protein